jgi:hypothetical protein
MKLHQKVIIAQLAILIAGCSGQHLITDESYRNSVDSCFKKTEALANNRREELFSVFENDLSVKQIEAMKFLYAFMPLNDLADCEGSFFLANVNMSLAALEETSWGSSIPEDIFLHYLLPVRVNNENLDSFRIVFYDELKNRVHGKTMKEAALEINHWCHEKVSYQPSDSRTSAPMSTILSARGRCGEESTFTVAALRTAGIPARQVYTPRWAHSDDNHAWVEFWADGTWYYMGACEPEAVPDRGWFTEPARRAMLIHTKSFGAFSGSENILNRFDKYTEVNNLAKYAVTKRIFIIAVDVNGRPVKDASIEYQLYNYAEFYPIATVLTNDKGISSLETGLGDLLIWGRKNDDFGFRKISVGDIDTLKLVLENKTYDNVKIDLDLSVPVKRTIQPGPSSDLSALNDARLTEENKIRQNYIDSWIKRSEAVAVANSLDLDTAIVADIILGSMGNYKTIVSLLTEVPDQLRHRTLALLKTVADKDLRDTRESVFSDHIINSGKISSIKDSDVLFVPYVLNPRISNEILSPWRRYFQNVLPQEFVRAAVSDPGIIVSILDTAITVLDKENYSRTSITPIGVWELRVSDARSQAICFVAICRSLGIASRLEPGSNIPQYWFNDEWHDVYFKGQRKPFPQKGYVKLFTTDKNPVPGYYIHFTLARFENGRYNTLEYNENQRVSDFREELQLSPGNYMLVTGNRLNDSRILASLSFFTLAEGEHKNIGVKLRRNMSPPEILGKADLKAIASLITNDDGMLEAISGSGAVVLWIEPDKEPTKHVLNDLPLLREELNTWPGCFIFLNVSGGETNEFISPEKRATLPERSFFGNDIDLAILKKTLGDNTSHNISFPMVLMINGNGDIILRSDGYRIGIGEQILRLSTSN